MSVEVGSIVEGVVTGVAKFGAFIEMENKQVGLVHISEVADTYVTEVSDHVKVGDKVKVKVVSADANGKIGLSIKQAQPRTERVERPRSERTRVTSHGESPSYADRRPSARRSQAPMSFEDKLSRFLKDSDERLSDLKRNTESKRGGRGARRSD